VGEDRLGPTPSGAKTTRVAVTASMARVDAVARAERGYR
jgi:hypothetical protein